MEADSHSQLVALVCTIFCAEKQTKKGNKTVDELRKSWDEGISMIYTFYSARKNTLRLVAVAGF